MQKRCFVFRDFQCFKTFYEQKAAARTLGLRSTAILIMIITVVAKSFHNLTFKENFLNTMIHVFISLFFDVLIYDIEPKIWFYKNLHFV